MVTASLRGFTRQMIDIGMAHQQWSSSTAVDGVWEALIRRSSSASFGVKGWGLVVGNVAYRLAPEYKFPVLLYDAYDSVRCVGILGIGAEDVTDDCVGCKECSELWCKPGERLHCWWILWRCDIRCYGQSSCRGR
jgi:alpha/beta hydrolase fold